MSMTAKEAAAITLAAASLAVMLIRFVLLDD